MAGEDPHEMTKDEKAAEEALAELSRRFPTLRWDFRPDPVGGHSFPSGLETPRKK